MHLISLEPSEPFESDAHIPSLGGAEVSSCAALCELILCAGVVCPYLEYPYLEYPIHAIREKLAEGFPIRSVVIGSNIHSADLSGKFSHSRTTD